MPEEAQVTPGAVSVSREMTLEEWTSSIRTSIKGFALQVKLLKERTNTRPVDDKEDRPEVLANLTLAYRCLEDASMRLGKVIQAHDGGVSVYDK